MNKNLNILAVEKALKETETTIRTVFEHTNDGISVGNLVHQNIALSNKMLGYDQEEITHLAVWDIHSAEELPYIIIT
jgi:hypothetical protein